MNIRLALAACALAPTIVFGQTTSAPAVATDTRQARIRAGAARLYDTSTLHRITITIAPEDVDRILSREKVRVRCTFTIDGRTLRNVGVRQSGGVYHPYQPITNKPSLSLKFDEFVDGQRLFDLDKLILKNELQDVSFVSEHLTYEIFRRAGLAAPLTAHARVTINGVDNGIYLMREPIDKEFLARNFGSAETAGNLYEIENVRDFVLDPNYPALDDEGKNGRTRRDLVAFATAIRSTTADTFMKDLSKFLDIGRFVTFFAAELATGHWDGFTSNNNNTYIYARPSDGKFIFIPYGADQTLGISRRGGGRGSRLRSMLAQRMLDEPALRERLDREVARISSAPVWNETALVARLNQVARIVGPAASTGRTGADVARFKAYWPTVDELIRP